MRRMPIPNAAASPPRLRRGWFAAPITIAIVFLLLFHHNGEVIRMGGIAASNIPILLIVAIFLASTRFLRNVPKELIAPIGAIFAMFVSGLYYSDPERIFFSIQAFIFILFPYSLSLKDRRTFILCMFLFAIASQIYLLILHGGFLPRDDIGGFFLTRRTVHSLFLGFAALASLQYVMTARNRVSLIAFVFLLMIFSQARGAAIAFLLAVLFFGQDFSGRWTRIGVAILATLAIAASVLLEPELVEHFQALLSLSGGSSTSYRLYLFQLLVDKASEYWLFGMRQEDIQLALANQFTRGLLYQQFPLDNSFVHIALNYGGFALLGLLAIAIRLVSMRQGFAFFLVVWFLLDDITGSALGWLLIGLCLSQTSVRKRIASSTGYRPGQFKSYPPSPAMGGFHTAPATRADTKRR